MSETPDPAPTETPAPKRKRAKRTPGKPRAPRVKDPGILAIEKAAAEQKAQYRKAQESGGVLKRILDLLPRLTIEDADKLTDILQGPAADDDEEDHTGDEGTQV